MVFHVFFMVFHILSMYFDGFPYTFHVFSMVFHVFSMVFHILSVYFPCIFHGPLFAGGADGGASPDAARASRAVPARRDGGLNQ